MKTTAKTVAKSAVRLAALAFLLASWNMVAGGGARAGEVYYGGVGGTSYTVPTTSLKEKRFATTVKQQYDFSCGSAALATLLTYHYGRPVSETEVFSEMWDTGDQEKIRTEGFSMLDMQNYLKRHGLRADGYRSELGRLIKARIPAIALVNTNGYMHFVVVKGVKDGRILVADPSLGTKVVKADEFEKMWNQVFFVVLDEAKTAQMSFNRAEDWAVQPKAPVELAREMNESLGGFLMGFPASNHF